MPKKSYSALNTTLIRNLNKKIEELKESEAKFKAIFEGASDGILVADAHTKKLILANARACEITGYPLKELMKLNMTGIHPKKDLGYVIDQFTRQVKGEITLAKNIPVLRKDKTVVYCDVNSRAIKIHNQDVLIGLFRDMTEWREAEEDMKKFKSMVESAHDAIFFKDLKSRYLIVNDKTLEAFGLPRKEVIGKNDYELMPDRKEAMKNVKDDKTVFRTGKDIEITKHMMGADGKEHWFEAIKVPQYDNKGNIIGLVGIARDITERKKAEEKLKESEIRFQQVAKNSLEWIWEVNTEGVYTYSSPVVQKILGYKPSEIVGKKHFYDMFDRQDKEILKKAAFEKFKKKQPFHGFMNRNLHKNGKTIWLMTSGVPIIAENGELLGYRGADIDITERKKAEEALKESKRKLRLFIDSSPDLIFLKDENLKYSLINKANAKFFGKDEKDIIGKTDFNLMPRKAALGCRRSDKAAIKQKKIIICEEKVGDKTFETRKIPVIIDNKILGIAGIIRDVTERKKVKKG